MDSCNYDKTELSSISKTVNEKLHCEKNVVNGLDASKSLDKDKGKKEKSIKFSCRQKVCLAILAAAEFTSFCSMSIMAPFYPQEAANKGMSESMAGFVFGFYALVIFLSSPFFGKIIPKVGVKFLFIAGMFSSGVCSLGFGTLHHIDEYTWFTVASFVMRGIEALGASAYSTAGYVIVVNTFPESAGTVRGILETFVGLGMSAGPGIGGLLYAVGGFGLPFYVMGIIMICIAPLNMCLVPKCEKISVDKNSGSITNLLKLPPVITTCFIMVTVSMTWGFLDPTLEPHLRKFQLSATNVGLIFLILSATYGISCPIWGYLSDKLNTYWWLMIVGLFGSSVALLLLGPSPMLNFIEDSILLNIVALSALGVFAAMALMPTYQYILDSSIEYGFTDNLATHSVIAGLWSSIYSLGDVLGPILGGTLLENYQFPISATSFSVLNFVVGTFSLVFFVYMKKSPKAVNFLKVCANHTDAEYYKAGIKNKAVESNLEVIKSIHQ